MREFKLGDRVLYRRELYNGEGVVVSLDVDLIGVRSDTAFNGFFCDCDGACESGYGRWFWSYELELLSRELLTEDCTIAAAEGSEA